MSRRVLSSMADAIGETPLLELARFAPDAQPPLLAKLELLNPYSVKDRAVKSMLTSAVASRELLPGGQVVEATSGNTGIALAMLAAAQGFRAVLVMSEIQSVERRQVLRALGAELILTPKAGGTKAARARAKEIAVERGAFYLGQHDNPANPLAHEEHTAEELWRDTEGRIDMLVAGLGTGGTLIGVARALKPRKPDFEVIGVEPANAPIISQGAWAPHRIMGTAPGFLPKIIERERERIDRIETASEDEAFAACREIARTEGLLVGISCGAAAHVARRLAADPAHRGKTIACIFADSGQRYLSVKGLFQEPAGGQNPPEGEVPA